MKPIPSTATKGHGASPRRTRLGVACAAIVLSAATPSLCAELPPDLARTLRVFDQAHADNNVDLLSQLTSDGYMVLNSNISLENKQQFLADFHLSGFKIEPYVRTEESNSAWNDAAVTAGVVDLSWTQDGKHHTRKLRYVDVWRKRLGRWEATFTQVTVVK